MSALRSSCGSKELFVSGVKDSIISICWQLSTPNLLLRLISFYPPASCFPTPPHTRTRTRRHTYTPCTRTHAPMSPIQVLPTDLPPFSAVSSREYWHHSTSRLPWISCCSSSSCCCCSSSCWCSCCPFNRYCHRWGLSRFSC